MNPRIKTKPSNYNELIELTRDDVHTVWMDEKLCLKYISWMERAIKSTKDPMNFLQYMEYYVEECIFELNNIETPCYQEENYGKAGEQPAMSQQSSNMIYELIPRLTEYLSYLKPHKTSIFAVNHYFRTILVLCRRCIELDIECFRLLEIIFGFIRKDASKFRFYDVCGVPKSMGGYRSRSDCEWRPKDYGNGEMALFLRIEEIEMLKTQTKQELDELVAKAEQMEEYKEEIEEDVEVEIEEEIEIESSEQIEKQEENDANTSGTTDDNKGEESNANDVQEAETEKKEDDVLPKEAQEEETTLETEEAQEITQVIKQTKIIKRKVMKKEKKVIIKQRKKQLSATEIERIQTLRTSLETYEAEQSLVETETKKIYYIDGIEDYPVHKYLYCGAKNEQSREESWFKVNNINYWGKIGGFDTMLKRIAHANCAVAVSDLVNLIRPVAQLRDLLNREYFESFVEDLRESLKLYYQNLPDLVVRELNKQTVEKSLKNLHYMMNNHYDIEQINEAKEKLKLQIAGRQFKAPYAQSRIFGMNDICRYIDLSIEKHELKNKKQKSWNVSFAGQSADQKQRENMISNLWLDSKFMCDWVEEAGVLKFILNRKTTHIELIKRLGPFYKLLKYNNRIDIHKHIDPLWTLTLHGQHEAIRYIVYELICDLAESLNLQQTKHLFLQIAKTPKPEYDSQMLQLIKKITIQAFKKQEAYDKLHQNEQEAAQAQAQATAAESEEKKEKTETAKKKKDRKSWFGLDLLWKFVQSADAADSKDKNNGNNNNNNNNEKLKSVTDKNVKRLISEKTAREALDIFLELLSKEYAISQRNAYMEKCIWHIQESQKVVQNLKLLQQLIQTFPRTVKTFWGTDTTQKPNTQNGVIERLERDYAIIDHLLQDLAFYKGTVMSIDTPAAEANGNKISLQTLRVDNSSFGYLEQIKIRQDFLLFLLTHSGLRLTRAQYRRIWDHLVAGALCREEMDLCFLWLLRGSIPPHFSSSNDSHYRLYNQQDQRYLFEHCIRRLPAAHLSETGYLLVVSFFCSVNKRAGTLSIKGEKKKLPRRAGDDMHMNNNNNNNNNNNISTKIDNIKSKLDNIKNKSGDNDAYDKTNKKYDIDVNKPTLKTRQHLRKYVANINSDSLNNRDGTYLIDPDDHYIDSKRLRVIDYDGLDGLTYFWDIVLKAVLPSVGLQAIELLNALHFYFAPRIKSTHRDDIRQQHVKKCLVYLDQALKSDQNKDKNKIITKRMIMLLKQFLESFVVGNNSQNGSLRNAIDIEIAPDKEFRTKRYIERMELSDKFGSLRARILDKLSKLNSGLILEHLIIKWNDKYTITQEQHDGYRLSKLDWSQSRVLEIKRVRYAFCRYFWLVPQSQQPIADNYGYPVNNYGHNSSNNRDHKQGSSNNRLIMSGFKRVSALEIFSSDENIYAQLFPLLQRKKIGPAVWDILNLLPPSHIRVRRIIDLGFESKFVEKKWNEIFDLNKPYQLLYYLQILCAVFNGEEWKKEYISGSRMARARPQCSHLEWIQRFIDLGGFSFITQLLFKIDLNQEKELTQKRINVNCVAFLFQIVSMLLSMDKTFKSVINTNKCVADGSITNFKDFAYIEGKLIQTALNISQKILLWSDLAQREREEKDEKEKEEKEKEVELKVDDRRSHGRHLKITRQVSDFSNLANITDLGPNGATILVECLQIMIGCIRTNPKYVTALFEMEHLTQWLTSLLLNTQYPSTRPSVSAALEMLARVESNTNIKLLTELMRIFSSQRSQTQDCREFFELLLSVFDNVCRVYKNKTDILLKCKQIAAEAFSTLKKYKSHESYAEPEICDEYLVGILNLICISLHHQLYDVHDNDLISAICEYIYYDCLFNVPSNAQNIGAKCIAAASRRIAYSLLHKLNEKYPSTLAIISLEILRDPVWYHMNMKRGSLQKASWHYHPSDLERFPVRYVGLKNQGATCYMNSLVQQLFVVDEFRRNILSARTTTENKINEHNLLESSSVLYQIQLLFGYLMKSQKKYYDTMPLCRVLKGFDGEPLPIGEQQDVNEFCARLFDQLESNLKLTSAGAKCIDSVFGGTLINQMISKHGDIKECGHKSEREEAFHTVSLTVKNKSCLRESLELYVAGDILDGDNKWLCSECDAKRAALKRVCFGRLPAYLILHLSRFEFDFNLMRRKKLNTRFEFPFNLNMFAYTKEGLEGNKTSATVSNDGYYEYKLAGVIVHTGGAEAGHYYSYAQSSDNKWWEFNDVDVTPFDGENKLDDETFGGKHIVTIDDPKEKGKKLKKECDKPYNAYMLIYKQFAPQNNIKKEEEEIKKDINIDFEEENNKLNLAEPIQETIWSENLKFLCDKNVFDFDYLTFLWQTVQLSSIRGNPREQLYAIQIATCFVFEILIRAKDNGTFPRWMRCLYKMYQQSESGRKWFLNKCAQQKLWFINTMFYNAHKAARLAFGDLLLAVIHYQSATDRIYYAQFIQYVDNNNNNNNIEFNDENDICCDAQNKYLFWCNLNDVDAITQDRFTVARFIVCCFRLLHFSSRFHRSYVEFFQFLRGLASISYHERLLMVKLGCIRSISAFYLNDTPIIHFNRMVVGRSADSGQRQTRRIAPPRCAPLIELLSILIRSSSSATFPSSQKMQISNNNNNNNNNNLDIDTIDLPPEEDEEEENEENINEEEEDQKEQKEEDINNNNNNNLPPYIFDASSQSIPLSDSDRRCLWNGLDPASASVEWNLAQIMDPTPTYAEYNKFIEHQSALTTYRKKQGRDVSLPPNLQIVCDRIESRKHLGNLAPRKLPRGLNILQHLFRDRSGANNSCSFDTECIQIINYWCHNNWQLTEILFDYLYHRVADEFAFKTSHEYVHYKSVHEYGPYLKCIEELLIHNKNDINYQRKIKTFIPKLITLFKRCSKTDDNGTDLLLFQLTSFFVRISFKDEFVANWINRDDGVLEYCLEEYRVKHDGQYQANQYQANQPQNNAANNNHYNNNANNNKGYNMRRQ